MSLIELHYDVPGDDFSRAGEASGNVKAQLKKLGFDPALIRNVVIALYEGEINMVIHANGGTIDVSIDPDCIRMVLADHGPGIADVELAMQAGYSTACAAARRISSRSAASTAASVSAFARTTRNMPNGIPSTKFWITNTAWHCPHRRCTGSSTIWIT